MGKFFLRCFERTTSLRDRLFTLAVRGAFERVGPRTTLALPIKLRHVDHVSLGARVWIGPGSWIQTLPGKVCEAPRIEIGEHCLVSGEVVLTAALEIVLEAEVLLGRGVHIADHSHAYGDTALPVHAQGVTKTAPVRIEYGAWLGQGVVVCPGVTIGRGAVIGAGSVVTRDIPAHSVAVGSPAKVIKTFGDPESSAA
ncbi:MAG: acyltransferase [Planctomycetota bacterium]|nr:acyltransferase [Planctomycetota bacterium]